MSKHAVLSPGIMYAGGERGVETREIDILPASLEDLMDFALMNGLSHLWLPVSSDKLFTHEDARYLIESSSWDVGINGKFVSVQKQGKYKGYVSSVTGRRLRPSTPNTRVIFVGPSGWPFDNISAQQLLQTIDKIETRLGVSMSGAPTSVGLRYLEKMNKRYYDAYFEKSDSIDWSALKAEHVPQLMWFPPVDVDDTLSFLETTPYLHCFDRQSSHAYAASQEDMGVGKPEVQVGGLFDKKKPGLWDVGITPPANLPANFLPLLPKNCQYLPTPMLRVAQIAGYTVKVNQAIIWPKGAPVFERWAKDLWAFRREFPDGSVENKAIKSVMNNTVGSTRVGEEMDTTLRPDWYATVVGSERAVVWYKAWKIAQDSMVFPCGCYADALYYLSFSENPEEAVPGILKPDSLGGYKHVWTLPVDSQVRTILTSKTPANMRIAELKKLVRAL